MPVYTFSTKRGNTEDTKMVDELKDYCDKHGIVFSSIVLSALKQYMEQQNDGKR